MEGVCCSDMAVNSVVLAVVVIMNVVFGAWSRCHRANDAQGGGFVGQPLAVCERQQIEGEWFYEK